MRSITLLLLLGAAVVAQDAPEPEPGLISTDLVYVGELVIPAKKGDPAQAHKTFLAAHRDHKKGALLKALQGYVDFLGMPGHAALPNRYTQTARERLDTLREAVTASYDRAVKLYGTDRAGGLTALRSLQNDYSMLPEGRAASTLVQSDATRAAVRDARLLAERSGTAQAARELEKAVRANPGSLFLYEAKSLLLKLGGPDLFDPDERIGDDDEPADARDGKDRDEDEESVIEIGD